MSDAWLKPLMLFGSTFALVFALGLQSQFVHRRHMVAAMLNSFCIGGANLVLFKLTPNANAFEIAGFLLGGPFGIALSMLVYRRVFMREAERRENFLSASRYA